MENENRGSMLENMQKKQKKKKRTNKNKKETGRNMNLCHGLLLGLK